MRVVGVEEHLVTSAILAAWGHLPPERRDLAYEPSTSGDSGRRLLSTGVDRRAAMEATGLDVQVLSLTTPGLQNLPPDVAEARQGETNDAIAAAVAGDPEHYGGLATLAAGSPEAAARELRRAVTALGLDGAMLYGRTGAAGLDDPALDPLWAVAEELTVPLHLHPQSPPQEVQAAYYDGFGAEVSAGFATHGIGWHYDSGVQLVRLILSGVFDRHPGLQIVVGHWGELVLFYLERLEHLAAMAGLPHTFAEYVRRNVLVTPSGMLSDRYLRWAIEVIGAERILFATDYPFEASSKAGARAFLEGAPITEAEREAIAWRNWQRLTDGIRR